LTSGGVSAEEAEGRAKLLLHKKLTPAEGPYYAGRPFNITLQVWNQGPGNAYSVVVTDENWKQDKFRTVFQGNNFTLDFLNAGEQYVHEFTVVPVKTILAHRVKPAKMVFVDGVEGDSTITHHSNSWPEIRVMDPEDSIADYLLMIGRLVTFNTIKTKKGWVWAGGFAALFGIMQTYYIGSAIMQKRRRIKALEDVKKM
jgi:hypothetical protein